MASTDNIQEILNRGVDSIYPSKPALEKRLKTGKPLKLYLGVDPSGEDLHIGRTIPLQKLRQFQDAGHQVVLLIGDFTGQTGDPTDKQATRVPLTKKQVLANAKHYQQQAAKILRFTGPNAVQLKYNAEWLSKLSFDQVAELAGHFTVQQMIERDMFANRLKDNKPISLREFLYPLMQGYDSVAMEVDLEIGGTDQTFNMLTGRKLVKEYLGKDKFVMTMQILADSNGVKLGKTEGNAIAIAGAPNDLYGQVMTLPDEAIATALELATSVPQSVVQEVAKLARTKPRDAKMRLAHAIVTEYHDAKSADAAQENFINVFQHKEKPVDMPTWSAKSSHLKLWELVKGAFAVSSSEARRKISEGAVRIDDQVKTDPEEEISMPVTAQLGKKRFVNVRK